MSQFIAAARKFVVAEEGATLVEYGLLVALIAVIAVGGITTLGSNVSTKFNSIASSIGGS